MSVIRLTKEFNFEAAHMLEGYDGLCREIHGHSYRLFVTICSFTMRLRSPKSITMPIFGDSGSH